MSIFAGDTVDGCGLAVVLGDATLVFGALRGEKEGAAGALWGLADALGAVVVGFAITAASPGIVQLHSPRRMCSRWHVTPFVPLGVIMWKVCAIGVRSQYVHCALHGFGWA